MAFLCMQQICLPCLQVLHAYNLTILVVQRSVFELLQTATSASTEGSASQILIRQYGTV